MECEVHRGNTLAPVTPVTGKGNSCLNRIRAEPPPADHPEPGSRSFSLEFSISHRGLVSGNAQYQRCDTTTRERIADRHPDSLPEPGPRPENIPTGQVYLLSRKDQALILRHLYGCSSGTWSYYNGWPRGWGSGKVQELDDYISQEADFNITGDARRGKPFDLQKGGILRTVVRGDWTMWAVLDIAHRTGSISSETLLMAAQAAPFAHRTGPHIISSDFNDVLDPQVHPNPMYPKWTSAARQLRARSVAAGGLGTPKKRRDRISYLSYCSYCSY